jgi:hypothetical protein
LGSSSLRSLSDLLKYRSAQKDKLFVFLLHLLTLLRRGVFHLILTLNIIVIILVLVIFFINVFFELLMSVLLILGQPTLVVYVYEASAVLSIDKDAIHYSEV